MDTSFKSKLSSEGDVIDWSIAERLTWFEEKSFGFNSR